MGYNIRKEVEPLKVLLINPPNQGYYHRLGAFYPPLGLGYISSLLRSRGHKVKIVDMNVQDFDFTTARYEEFDLVGISVDTVRFRIGQAIAKAVKKKGVPVVVGGPHVSAEAEDILRSGIADYVVIGEGEVPMLELVEALESGDKYPEIQGVAYLQDQAFKFTPGEFLKDLDSLPFPDREELPMNAYKTKFDGKRATSLITSRGCPFDCEFCSASQFMGRLWRKRSVGNVLEEVKLLVKKLGFGSLIFFDDNFTLDPKRVVSLCEGMLKNNLRLSWWAFSRADEIVGHEDMVEAMAKAGCKMLFVGFESADDAVLAEYQKRLDVLTSSRAVQIMKKYKIDLFASFIIGALNDTKESIKKTVKYAKKLGASIVQFSILTPYPGTKLFMKLKDKLITRNYDLFDGTHLVFNHPKFSAQELRKLFVKAYFYVYSSPRLLFKRGLPFFWKLVLSRGSFQPHSWDTALEHKG